MNFRKAFAEVPASFLFVATTFVLLSSSPLPLHVSIAWSVALGFVVYVYAAHVNPAVSLGAAVAEAQGIRALPKVLGVWLAYVIGQCLGIAIAIEVLLFVATGSFEPGAARQYVVTVPQTVSVWEVMLLEAIGGFILTSVVLRATSPQAARLLSGLLVGLSLLIDILWFGQLTGGSFNPARAIVPLLLAGPTAGEFVFTVLAYVSGPLLGGLAAGLYYRTHGAS